MIRYLCPAKSFFIINHHHYQSFFNTSCKMWADDLLKTTKYLILDAKQQTNFFLLGICTVMSCKFICRN